MRGRRFSTLPSKSSRGAGARKPEPVGRQPAPEPSDSIAPSSRRRSRAASAPGSHNHALAPPPSPRSGIALWPVPARPAPPGHRFVENHPSRATGRPPQSSLFPTADHAIISRPRASVAQLDRAFDFGSKGCRFESCRTRHLSSMSCGDYDSGMNSCAATLLPLFVLVMDYFLPARFRLDLDIASRCCRFHRSTSLDRSEVHPMGNPKTTWPERREPGTMHSAPGPNLRVGPPGPRQASAGTPGGRPQQR